MNVPSPFMNSGPCFESTVPSRKSAGKMASRFLDFFLIRPSYATKEDEKRDFARVDVAEIKRDRDFRERRWEMRTEMRLAYRIASMTPLIHNSMPRDLIALAAKDREIVLKAENIIADNVADFYALGEKHTLLEDCPNWLPPFQNSFVEYNQPVKWHTKDGDFEAELMQMGISVIGNEVDDKQSHEQHFFDLGHSREFAESFRLTKWVLTCRFWSCAMGGATGGKPRYEGVVFFLTLKNDGTFLCHSCISTRDEETNRSLYCALCVAGLTLSFLHCKNVAVSNAPINNKPRWHRQHRVPVVKFRTLNINPMKETLRTVGGIEANGFKKALHICRGHFANYSEEKPLFGKFVGQFWKPSHVRGDIKAGAVVKDYKVAGVQP